jgi:hypothetical protein
VECTFLAAYFSTRFWVEEPARSLMEFGVILSGYATTGQVWADQKNRQSDLALESLLRTNLQYSLVRLIGYSPSLDHAEPSWLIDLNCEEGCRIGVQFQQDALYSVEAGEIFVVDCQDPTKRAYVGRFLDRLDWLDPETMRKCLQGDGPFRFGA